MKPRSIAHVGLLSMCVLLVAASGDSASAQQATERYIPIGASPGVSGESSYIGELVDVDRAGSTLTVEDESGRHRVRVTEQSRVWLDRSAVRRANLEGSFADCEVGRRVEIRTADDDATLALWVKIETR